MYNEAFKRQFIKDDTTNKNFDKFMPRYFETIEKYEKEYGKDLCNFNVQEIENYFLGLSTASFERCQNIKAQFIKYSQYCLERNMVDDNQIHWQEIDGEYIKRILNQGKINGQLVTKEQLLMDLMRLDNASDMFIVLSIFEGICGNKYKDLHHLDIKQFYEKNGKYFVKLKDKNIEISQKLYDLAFESASCYLNYPITLGAKREVRLNKEDPWVLKRAANSTVDDENTNIHRISNRLAAIRNIYSLPYCTQSALMTSGRLHCLYVWSDYGKRDIEDVLNEHFEEITMLYGRIQVKSALIDKYKQLYGEKED